MSLFVMNNRIFGSGRAGILSAAKLVGRDSIEPRMATKLVGRDSVEPGMALICTNDILTELDRSLAPPACRLEA